MATMLDNQLPLLAEDIRKDIFQHWNTEQTAYSIECIHTLIEQQVSRTPEISAVEFQGVSLSYKELNIHSNIVAHQLLSMGVQKNEMIGLCMDRSIEMIVAVVAIFKAGCCVVPLDASYPKERLDFMISDSALNKVITTSSLLVNVPETLALFADVHKIYLDKLDYRSLENGVENPDRQNDPDGTAYCIYTSGSTGLPKGVIIEHKALANLVAWHKQDWLSEVGVRTLLFSPISFDVSFHEIVAGLCLGATLVQIDEETRSNPLALTKFAREEKIEKWYMPFVTLQQVSLAAKTAGYPTNLKELIVGGEPLRITDEIRELSRRSGCVIQNNYGSTECLTITTYSLSGDPDKWPSLAPIGKPTIYNTNVYILNEDLKPVGIGEIGEIYADGACLAKGYHNRPDLNEERFIRSPFGIQGARLYRTKDLGRYLPDGNIECIGRADNQVKIRGYRVEIGEIEAALAAHDLVSECVVSAKKNSMGTNKLYAYIVPVAGHKEEDLEEAVYAYLSEKLPNYMVPSRFIFLKDLPLTPSGKVDIRNLPAPESAQIASVHSSKKSVFDFEILLKALWSEILERSDIDIEKTFFEQGGDSLLIVRAHQRTADMVDGNLSATALFKYPSIEKLAKYLFSISESLQETNEPESEHLAASLGKVAIIGMSCRVPGAETPESFWKNLENGIESIQELRDEEIFRIDDDILGQPNFVKVAAMLPNIDMFDADFFGYSAAEAEVLDPQQRLFLESAWEALENAGINPHSYNGEIGVYAGSSMSTYLINNVLPTKAKSKVFLSHRHFKEATELRIEQGNASDHLPTRVSYKLNLRGPSLNVQTTCSTSLVAVHLACQALLNKECDVALAGGVSVITPQNTGYVWGDGMMLSHDGHCRAFDKNANGTIFGNGLGIVVLKQLDQAIKDGDHIYAVIAGSAVNNDGASKMDYAGPNIAAQTEVIVKAHKAAKITADQISYVEAHGTATILGDPIEIYALDEAFKRTQKSFGKYCSIGSVKTNIGHLDEAAGIAGLIKTALAIQHKKIPPSLNFESPNSHIDFDSTPFQVQAALTDWKPHKNKIIAGVSSFGMGGTNCHVVIEEPPEASISLAKNKADRPSHVLSISGKSPEALKSNIKRYADYISNCGSTKFSDICYSAGTRRNHFQYRASVLAQSCEEAAVKLYALLKENDFSNRNSNTGPRLEKLAFMFTGQGAQYSQMGRSLYETQPVFKAVMEECDIILRSYIGKSIISILYDNCIDENIDDTSIAQPALFSLEYALFKLWESWGVVPDVMIGHSLGEYVAACAAGIFSLEDGLRLVSERGRLMKNLQRDGRMAQIYAPSFDVETQLEKYSINEISIAAINTDNITVISGQADIVKKVCDHFKSNGIDCTDLSSSHAFHSPLMEPMLSDFRKIANNVIYTSPKIPIISNITGALCQKDQLASADYWVDHIVETVRFSDGLSTIHNMGVKCYLELGPKPILSSFTKLCLRDDDVTCLSSISPQDVDAVIETFSKLYRLGYQLDWKGFDKPFDRSYISLPTYAFQRKKYWLDTQEKSIGTVSSSASRKAQAYEIVSVPFLATDEMQNKNGQWVVVHNSEPHALSLIEALEKKGEICTEIPLSSDVSRLEGSIQNAISGYQGATNIQFLFIGNTSLAIDIPEECIKKINIARRLIEGALHADHVKNTWFVMSGLSQEELSDEGLSSSCISGLVPTANAEHPDLNCVLVDFPQSPEASDYDAFYRIACSYNVCKEERLSIRKGNIFASRLRPIPYEKAENSFSTLPIKTDGTYLITGGTGGIGLRLALRVAKQSPKRLILLSRSGRVNGNNQSLWHQIQETGTLVDIIEADLGDKQKIRKIFSDILTDGLDGVFHCAGNIDDGILINQTEEKIRNVFVPKVYGAWLLHKLTLEASLDFFVMFSSSASFLGYGGQSIYAAANSFLDNLARYRVARNLPGLSLSWGSWGGPGMSERMSAAEKDKAEKSGESLIDAEDAFNNMAAIMKLDLPHSAILAMDWDQFVRVKSFMPLLISDVLKNKKREEGQQGEGSFRALLKAAEKKKAIGILHSAVTQEIISILGDDECSGFDEQTGFIEMGIDSLGAINLRSRLQAKLSCQLPATLAFDYPCLQDLMKYLETEHFAHEINFESEPEKNESASEGVTINSQNQKDADLEGLVAIIGMSCRLPNASSPDEFWSLLSEGRDAVQAIPEDRWKIEDFYDENPNAPGKMYIKEAAFIKDVDCFDSAFFGISPHEAMYMDPRQRMLLEVSWEAIERAGIDPSSLRGSDMGVYIGGDEFINDYLAEISSQNAQSDAYTVTGNALGFSAGRLSYKYGLHGPSMTIATACSSSLVALHSAVQAVLHRDCSTALVGSAKLMLRPEETIQLCKLKALSPDGRSKAFSADADGYGRGEGCGVVVLKRLDQALADKNPVLAIIRATAANHDGPSAGLTVPNKASQINLINNALQKAKVSPADITYIEAHGTGTQLGDPIEISALGDVFSSEKIREPILVGSVKANIGHLEEAAGIAGLIKVVLCLQAGCFPQQAHAEVLNKNISWEKLRLRIPKENVQVKNRDRVIAGLSSFGMTGTNVHAILEDFPKRTKNSSYLHNAYIFVFSARDKEDLVALVSRYIGFDEDGVDPCDLAYTLQVGRKIERVRLAIVADGIPNLKKNLGLFIQGHINSLYAFYEENLGSKNIFDNGDHEDSDVNVRTLISEANWGSLAVRWCAGEKVNWALLYEGSAPGRIVLPTYPFKQKKIWIDNQKEQGRSVVASNQSSLKGEIKDINTTENLSEFLRQYIAKILGMESGDIQNDSTFYELGADSLTFIRVSQYLKDQFQLSISFQQLFEEGTTLEKLTELVAGIAGNSAFINDKGATQEVVNQKPSTFSASKIIKSDKTLTWKQSDFLKEFTQDFSVRTQKSKNQAQSERPFIANCRMAPFRSYIKEISYPIVGRSSSGARMWDVDGNEYVDISMGYGVHLFGHQPEFITNALKQQLDIGMQIGPLSEKAGAVARLLCELTGMDRVAFCNSGTEAIMAALRFARAATGRTKFIMFEGSYHGWSDSTLGLPAGISSSLPMARGIGHGAMDDVIVLEYGTEESLEIIKSIGNDLAAVLVEPIQSRRPDLRPKAFLESIRSFTHENGIALIFDEVITGFRVHPGGAQAWYGIEADLVTYGKILGGGMPIGAVAGRARFLDTVDGGAWQYGNQSSPLVPTTFYGGTFNKNPLSMAAAESVLIHLKSQGEALQISLGDRVTKMAQRLNDYFDKENVPIRVIHFSSWFRFIAIGEYSLQRFPLEVDLFFYMMVHKGVYILETRVSFLSASHTDDDVDFIINTVKESVEEIREGGFFIHDETKSISTKADLLSDVNLKPDILVAEVRNASTKYKNILLTGATGFLGAYLLRDLLSETNVNVYCLVRGETQDQCLSRIKENLLKYDCWRESFGKRIVVVVGDLALPNLGLDSSCWFELSEIIDAVYHNGAHVNSLLPYEKLRASNVDGTKQLLRLASERKTKAFHYISSDAVFESYGYQSKDIITENEPLQYSDSIYGGGYSESKWVAEKIVALARDRGIPVSIYRPGMITGDTVRGIGQTGDFFARFFMGAMQIGVCPEIDAIMDFTPVDYVSRMIVTLSTREEAGKTYHLTHAKCITYQELIGEIQKSGFDVKIISYAEWKDRLSIIRYEDDNALYPLLPLLLETSDPIFRRTKMDINNSRAIGEELHRLCPDISFLIRLYLKYFVDQRMINRDAA